MSLTTPSTTSRQHPHPKPDNRPSFTLLSIDQQGIVRVRPEGCITALNFTADGKDPLESLLGANWRSHTVLLDMSCVAYIDSSAVGWLIGTQRATREGGGRLVVHSIQSNVRQILDLLKVGRVVPLAENESSALLLLNGGAA